MSRNLLADETSPYLLQHKDNPVHWRPWGDAAFAEAARDNKPVLLSVGYAACHWCHVMAHESFEHDDTAALMNQLFVNVKVDREERPDVDTLYQTALALLGEHGGWPLTMFLTPDGEPFWGGTYFPRDPRYGRPGFRDVLRRIDDIYRAEPEKVDKNRDALRTALTRLSANRRGGEVTIETMNRIALRILHEVDPHHGGLGSAPKFPQPSLFTFLWHSAARTGDPNLREAVLFTLTRMSLGGIYDHLGGGYARYATDSAWLVPHFEKMLYDNAQLIDLLTLAWQDTRTPLFATRVEETVAWVLREMISEHDGVGGGFASSLDADSEGEEGRFYVWDAAEIDRVLGDDAAEFKQHYDVLPGGNWEGHTILNRSALPPTGDAALEARLADARSRLFAVRESRVRPGWDDKVLADWNGLMIAALTRAAIAFDRPDWRDAARTAFAFVVDHMQQQNGRLFHSWRAGRARHPATVDDYANMARAAVALFSATGEPEFLDQARRWVALADAHYWDPRDGGYYLSADDTGDLITRSKTVYDNAIPAGNGSMLILLSQLYHLTGDPAYRDRADALVTAFSGEIEHNFLPLASYLIGNEFLQSALQVVVADPAPDPRAGALWRAAQDAPVPTKLVSALSAGQQLPVGHPAAGKGPIDGHAAAYVCRGPVCSLPITDPGALSQAMADPVSSEPI